MFLLKLKTIIPLALLTGLLATYGAYSYLESREATTDQPEIATRQVIVAAADLAVGTTLKMKDLYVSQWPENIVPAGSFEETDLLEDRVVRTNVTAGEVILKTKLAPTGSSGGLSSLIPAGMRAVTVGVNMVSGVSGFILPTTRVDVLVTVSNLMKKDENTTKIILQNVEVLAVDQTYRRDDDDPVTVKSVTLLVSPEDSEKLTLASNEGKLQLTLRSGTDVELSKTSGVSLAQLVDRPKPKPAKRRSTYKPKPKKNEAKVVEMLRANVRSAVELDE